MAMVKMIFYIGDTADQLRIVVFYGPISDNISASDCDLIYNGDAYGNSIVFGDVNGDGLDDMIVVDSAGGEAAMLAWFGLEAAYG